MKKLEFYGHSDDVFVAGDIEIYTNIAKVSCSDGTLLVAADYLKNGCWAIGIAPFDEDEKMADWPISYRQSDRGYSTVLVIEVPDDAKVESYVR